MEPMSLVALPTQDALLAALAKVNDPEIRRPVTELGMVKSVSVDDAGHVALELFLTVAGCPMKDTLRKDTSAALLRVPGVVSVDVALDVMSDEQRAALRTQLRGGVAEREVPFAKSRVADAGVRRGVRQGRCRQVLGHGQPRGCPGRRRACKVGVVDADIYGFSIPRMLGVEGRPTQVDDMILPPHRARREGDLDRHVRARQPARRLAWADAAPGPPAVPRRRLLG
jgi:ATP-binding protein involved in chromosome partitioning